MTKESLQKHSVFYCGPEIWQAAKSQMWMDMTGSDVKGVAIMMEKDQIWPIFVSNIYFGAGNILKQDMLSIGGDVVVHKYFINGKIERGDLIILGTAKQHRQLIIKMRTQHWGLKELAEEMRLLIENLALWKRGPAVAIVEPGSESCLNQDLISHLAEENFDLSLDSEAGARKLVDLMLKVPINQAKEKGFMGIKTGFFTREVFLAAISRGYYLEGE